jgi:anti-sigma regulatory factor (Ser/Thr protein kinase)
MAAETQDIVVGNGDHVVQFYEHDSELVGAVTPYLLAATEAEEVAIVIATETHLRAFEAELEADGVDLARARADGKFFALDAATTMAAFIAGGQIDHDAFREVIGGLVRKAAESGRAIRAYGEMVAILWDAGNVLAAIELETLWNDLARELPFSLFCSYPASSVSGSEHTEALRQVCRLHSSVIHPWAGGVHDPANRSPETEVAAKFAAERDAPGHARRLVIAALQQWGCRDALVQDAALVLTELATNAVLHAASPFSISVRLHESALRVAVQDACPFTAAIQDHGLIPRSGHGLDLIDALSARWGMESASDGKVVWAELRV